MAHYSNEFLLVAKNGNVAAFEQIYSDYKDRVYAIALSTLKNPQDAEDAVQQTFIKVYEKLSSLEDPSAFSTWIQRIAINESRMILRKRKEVLSMDDNEYGALVEKLEDDYMLPQEYLERDDLSRRMREIIDELPTAQRQALVLQMYSNLSMAEIAEVMDCSENTVKSRIRYAKATIKAEIEERERKSGEKFYGVVMLPFGSIFSGLVAKQSMSPAAAAQIWNAVSQHIAGIVAATGAAAGTAAESTAVGTGLSLGAKLAIGALIGAAVIGGTVFAVTKLTDAFSDKSAQTDPVPAVTEAITEAATQAVTQEPTSAPTSAPTEVVSEDYSIVAGEYKNPPLSPDTYITIHNDGTFDISAYEFGNPEDYREPIDAGVCQDLNKESDYLYGLTLMYDSGESRGIHIYLEDTPHSEMSDQVAEVIDQSAKLITSFDASRSGVLYFDDSDYDSHYYLTSPADNTSSTAAEPEAAPVSFDRITGHYTNSMVAKGAADITELDISGDGKINITVTGRLTGNKTYISGTAIDLTDTGNGIYTMTIVSDDEFLDGDSLTYYPSGTPTSLLPENDLNAINDLDGEKQGESLDTAYIVSYGHKYGGHEAFRLS